MVEVSIVIPAFNEEENVSLLYERVSFVMRKTGKPYEILFIDDGSRDRTLSVLKAINRKDKSARVIVFRRNFGQTAALDAGFKNAKGKIIVAMDADLQNDPEDIPRLISKLSEGYDCVSGWRFNRKDGFSKRIFSFFANIIRRSLTKEDIHDSGCTLKAYRRECFDGLTLFGEMHRFIPALLKWRGFKVTELKVKHHHRKFGKTKYNLFRVFKGFLDLLVVKFWMQYSARPIHLFGGVGLILSSFGLIIDLYLLAVKLFLHRGISDRPLLILGVLLIMVGVQFIIFGFLADILIKIYYKDSGNYSIKEIIQ